MQFINPIQLIKIAYQQNEIGSSVQIDSKRKVLASIDSIRQSEFYQAQVAGFKPSITFKIRSFEYKGEDELIYKDNRYTVIRSFNNSEGLTELICTEKVGVVSG